MNKQKIVVVVGATASGKSGLAIDIAKKFDGEVISADSRQIYKKLDIGTAKVTNEEMQGIPHHLIDIIDIDKKYSANEFKRDASESIRKIVSCGHLPIITGGTFFYIDSFLEKISAPEVPPNPALREYLADLSKDILFAQLEERDPERAHTIDRNNKRRLIRALEIVLAIGKVPPPTSHECPYDVLAIGIETEKIGLREQFKKRAHNWLERGFQVEVEELLADGVSSDRLHEIGFEYQLMLSHITGELNEEEFIQRFVEKNWQYAKRQMMWLKHDESIKWFKSENVEDIFTRVSEFLS